MTTRRALLASAALAPVFATVSRANADVATPTADRLPALAPVQYDVGISYGAVDGAPLYVLSVHLPVSDQPRPAVILVPGGGGDPGINFAMVESARALARAGYVAFAIDVRPFATNPWPAQLDDVQRAVRWVRANADAYGVDPGRIGSYGHSSGAPLAAMLGLRETRDNSDPALAAFSSRVSCVVELEGDMDWTLPDAAAFYAAYSPAYLGGSIAEAPAAYRDASPVFQVTMTSAPFLIFNGAAANGEGEQAQRMAAALDAAGVEVTLVEYPELGHFDWLEWRNPGPETLAFFGRHLRPDN